MITILLILFVLAAIGSFPAWPHASGWGYYPSSGLGLVVLFLVVLYFTGHRF